MVSNAGNKTWSFLYSFHGSRREMTLGKTHDLTITKAREKAAACRAIILDGIDPLSKRRVAPSEPFGEVAETLLTSLEAGWRNPKHRQQWRNTLQTYCAPFWAKPVAAVDTDDVLGVLSPIWLTKNETASRLRGRIERVLGAAKARGKRSGENPARWR